MNYFYSISSGEGGQKGEGIASYKMGYEAGRGALANGGGGGNHVNSGGAGGSNYSRGGQGGNQWNGGCSAISIGGIGGDSLKYDNSINKIYLGGGGGGGHQNDNLGTAGANGGGILIVRADSIAGNNHFILADGFDVLASAGYDGAGGGG